MKLCIVIPALNEEDSIEKIIVRSLEARDTIVVNTDVDDVEVTVVSDGSTDRTVEIASSYTDRINLIVFEKNKGYGAAIKEGWSQSDAELVAFLDADGTCDPKFFVELCNLITREGSDVALGCRLNKDSKMPMTRRLGNTLFSILLTFLSAARVKDTASGMRVVRRTVLADLMPLPDGLHFTPAMSARALLSYQINIREKDMPYEEREGESKLHIWKDGLRFLKVIVTTAALYRPNRVLTALAVLCFLCAVGLMLVPVAHYAHNHVLEDWMIYRFVVSNTIALLSVLLFSSSYLSEMTVRMALSNTPIGEWGGSLVYRMYSSPFVWVVVMMSLALGMMLIGESLFHRLKDGETNEHWSRYLAMSFFVTLASILAVTKILERVLSLISDRLVYLRSEAFTSYSK
jgi:glycosyltransferase involved in cell wall biosynthesis